MGIYRVEGLEPRTLLSSAPVLLQSADRPSTSKIVVANGIRFFTFSDATHGEALWRTDGRASGTKMVVDVKAGPTSPAMRDLTALLNWVYFVVDDKHLWRSDGTAAGSERVLTANARIRGLTVVGNALYATVENTHETSAPAGQFWRIDGSAGGTVDLFAGKTTRPRGITSFIASRDRMYLLVDDLRNLPEIWTSDGTAAGTRFVHAIADESPTFLGVLHGRLFFTARDGDLNLYRTDGASGASVRLKTIFPRRELNGGAESVGAALVDGDRIYFGVRADEASGNVSRSGLWATDGSSAGTVLIRKFPDTGASFINMRRAGQWIYFDAPTALGDDELWKTDGTPAGTSLVRDVLSGSRDSDLYDFTDVAGTLYFTATGANGCGDLWRSDGTDAGTVRLTSHGGRVGDFAGVADLSYVGGSIYFTGAPRHPDERQLYRWSISEISPQPSGSITGVAFNDLDGDGRRDAGEPPLPGVRVSIEVDDHAGIYGPGDSSLYTASNGRYTFRGLPPGQYRIRTQQPKGWAAESIATKVVQVGAAAGAQSQLNLAHTRDSSISGVAFIDRNGNGRRESNDPPVNPAIVRIGIEYPASYGLQTPTFPPNADGTWKFPNLPAGKFRIYAEVGGKTYEVEVPELFVTLEPGQNLTGYQFALKRRLS